MLTIYDFRKGLKIELNGEPFVLVDYEHVKPGKGGAFARAKIKSLITGNVREQTFRVSDRLESPDVVERQMQYLYRDGEKYCFMDNETYEQFFLTEDQVGKSKDFLKENINVSLLYYNGKPIGIELPIFVELEIVDTQPGVRGDTASGGTKPAILETGATVQVPLFLNQGDVIKIDTRTGAYIERVK
ncbi:MAG: elongation factor P [Deltaproteobacteria bacterium]|nr:elongation factor P [Deltaproteobacteria bacterium]MBW2123245.1 elongation factor P [Deltaproteobacteria bacterium]